MFKRTAVVVAALVALVGVLWGADVLADRRCRLDVVAEALLLENGPHDYPMENRTVAILRPGEHVRVLRLRYGKDFQSFRVETGAGVQGWVVAGRGVEVKSCE